MRTTPTTTKTITLKQSKTNEHNNKHQTFRGTNVVRKETEKNNNNNKNEK